MRNLKPIEKNETEYFQQVVGRKRDVLIKQLLRDISPMVNERYEKYVECHADLATIPLSPFEGESEKKALISCYEQEKKALTREIKSNQIGLLGEKCQYCDFNQVTMLDHYLPKAAFPEFSILGINLLPSCGKCNTDKGSQWAIENKRQFINFFYDDIQMNQFLFCEINFNQRLMVEFKLANPEGMSDSIFAIIQTHFARLKLLPFYERECVEQLVMRAKQQLPSKELFAMELSRMADMEKELKGKNNYKAVFYRKFAAKVTEFYAYRELNGIS